MIYFDNAAGTPVFSEICGEYREILETYYSNPSANHSVGFQMKKRIRLCEEQLLTLLGIRDTDVRIIWTSGGTEANNLALFGYVRASSMRGKISIVSTLTEHASVYVPLKKLGKGNVSVSWTRVDRSGRIDLQHLSDTLNENTRLVSLCHIQNETGVIHNLERVREIMDDKSPRAKFHVDASQAFGKIEIPWELARIDLLTLSSHKIHGPGGVGALLVRHLDTKLEPIIVGGGQQGDFRSGTLNTPGIIAFSLASSRMISIQKELWARATELNKKMKHSLSLLTDKSGNNVQVHINSPKDGSPYILNFSLPEYQGAVVMRMLGELGVVVGVGSACSAESKSPSRVLKAMGLSDRCAYGSVRTSFGVQNRLDEVDTFASKLQSAICDY